MEPILTFYVAVVLLVEKHTVSDISYLIFKELGFNSNVATDRWGSFAFKIAVFASARIIPHICKLKTLQIKSTLLRMNPATHSLSFKTVHLYLCSIV